MFNDFLMRVSLPGLGIFAIYSGFLAFHSFRSLNFASVVFLSCLLIGAIVPIRYLLTPLWPPVVVTNNSIAASDFSIKDLDKLHNGWTVSFQYTGNADSLYNRYLAKKP
jgi:hypothetical protein